MPEYLAPGVYVEEIDTGSKPIEGVSTSTVGMVGVTERGPVDVPMLVTSVGDFNRKFGGRLNLNAYSFDGRGHGYLPYAVESFFTNGGKRAYVTRVLPAASEFAVRDLFDRGADTSAETVLLRAAPQGSGTAINPPLTYVLDNGLLAVNDWVRVGDGSRAEYREIDSIAAAALHVALNSPLDFAHDAAATAEHITESDDTVTYTTGDFVVDGDTAAGAMEIVLAAGTTPGDLGTLVGPPPMTHQLLRVGPAGVGEYVFSVGEPAALPTGSARLRLAAPLKVGYANGTQVQILQIPAATTTQSLAVPTNAGDSVAFLDSLGGGFTAPDLIIIDQAGTHPEVRRITDIRSLSLDVEAYGTYGAGSAVQLVSMSELVMTIAAINPVPADPTWVTLSDVSTLEIGMTVLLDADGPNEASRRIVDIDGGATQVQLDSAPPAALVGGENVVEVKHLTADARADRLTLALDDRLGLAPGDVLQIGDAPDEEYVTIDEIVGERGVAPDAGNVQLTAPLQQDHPDGTEIRVQQTPAADPTRQPLFLVVGSGAEAGVLTVSGDDGAYSAGEVVSVRSASGDVSYHRLTAVSPPLTPRAVGLNRALRYNHAMGEPVVEREQLIAVRALDPGVWGNRLAVSVSDEDSGLASGSDVTQMTLSGDPTLPSTIRVASASGIEAGTVLELYDADSGEVFGDPFKVREVDRAANNLVSLDPGTLTAAHNTAFQNALLAGDTLRVRSLEFRLRVFLRRPPDAAVPSRNNDFVDSEAFPQLSMDPRHSRYVERIIGTTWAPASDVDDNGTPLRIGDRRSEGESAYIRVVDLAAGAAEAQSVRLGPEALVDVLPSGLTQAARHDLSGGDDAIEGLPDAALDDMYTGVDSDEPTERTALHSLRNIETISLLACPGQTTATVQQALIDQCELLRYRFAVLDGRGPTHDSLAAIQFQRQQFDSKYAALYHPWVTLPDPMPGNLASIAQVALPPSGAVLGIYARTDIERGVHKAPANEVVRGITGLARSLNKGEQDILNPYPVNINVIRDFRNNNRGIRVWGARVITSDPDYKYVNVRRLLIFLEHSIERGLQWVTFEPNAEPLWARVQRTISNFLTTVWRNGALEGTSPDLGFFVRCDRTTMTQDDIDNGRLICVIGVAPVKPAEYVIIRIGLWTASAEQQ